MPVQPPSNDVLRQIAARYALELPDEELAEYRRLMGGVLASYERLDKLAEPKPAVAYARTPGWRPSPEENDLSAWYWRCSIKGSESGKLAGKKVAIKDNVCVAGIPMMNGSSVLEGFVPDIDATIVARILDAGGEIVGKAVCEDLCFSGGSHTAATGPVHNPHDPTRSAGGSSSGSAALVVAGHCHMAIGGDQGGSIRLPSSYCGAYGLKPTYGLVPYTGVFPIERTLDHVGPIAATVPDIALLLEVIAGPDGLDARQVDIAVDDYVGALDRGVEGLRVGVVEEGFGWPVSQPDVDESVRAATEQLQTLGASVESVSIPWHRDGIHVWNAIAVEGALALMIHGNAGGTNAKGFYDTALIDAYRRGRFRNANDLAATVKLVVLLGEYMQTAYGGRYYAKARNLAGPLSNAYEEVLSRLDVLVMPTTPMKATPLPPAHASLEEIIARALEMIPNTCPFDVTGHPAVTIPCAMSNGLPVGLMGIGALFAEATLLRFAHALEANVAPPVGPSGRPLAIDRGG
jgi:amidase